jgi:hypothetical protein
MSRAAARPLEARKMFPSPSKADIEEKSALPTPMMTIYQLVQIASHRIEKSRPYLLYSTTVHTESG